MRPLAASAPAGGRSGLIGLAAVVLAAAPVAPARAQDAALQTFDIPAQDAATALLKLCVAADCELAFARRPDQAVRTRAVRGRMSWRSALARMLEGTGLRHRFVGERGVRIWVEGSATPAASPPSAPRPPETVEVGPVLVLGRLSDRIDESLRRKRDADVISDVLSSERIGELPASNLAEALQRVPGVAIEREVGEGQFVSVRGLGPLFQSVTLNGVPIAFNENLRNSTQSGRQFRFRALSVDLLAGARLVKSPTADLVEGGIGSNIDIETAGGLDAGPFASARGGGALESRTGRLSPDLSIAGRLVSADGDRGLIAGVSQEARAVRYDRFQIMRYGETVVDGRRLATPNDVRTTIEREDRRRRTAFVGADWRLSPGLRLDFDALVSTFDNAIREDRLVYGFGERLAAPGAILRVSEGVVTAARIDSGRIDNNTEVSDQAHLNVAASAGAVLRTGQWRLTPRLSASWAHSVLDTPLQRFSAQSPVGAAYVFDLGDAAATRRAARLETSLDLLDPSVQTPTQLTVRALESRDRDLTGVVDARRALDRRIGPLRLGAVRLGGQFSDRSRDFDRRDRRAELRSPGAPFADVFRLTTPDDVFADLIVARSTPWAVADLDRLAPAFFLPGQGDSLRVQPGDLPPSGADRQNSYRVGEQAAAAYVRLDFDGRLAGRPVFGNLGFRVVGSRTHVEGAWLESVGGAAEVQPVRFDGDHRALLPSANLAVDLSGDAVLRMAVSRSISRPSLADLRASTVPASSLASAIYDRGAAALDEPGLVRSGIGGNPALTPYVSTNLDLSYEVTRRRTGFSLAVFHKRITDFIQPVAAPEWLTFETRSGPPLRLEVMMSRPRNLGHAAVEGLEVGLHQRLPGGFGLWGSATVTNSRLQDGGRLLGASDLAWSVSPYLERGPLAANLSWSWRSPFRSEADLQGGGVSDFVVGSAGYLDAQLAYDLADGLQMIVSGSNLTDTRDLAYEGVTSRLLQLGSVGRQLSFAVRWAW